MYFFESISEQQHNRLSGIENKQDWITASKLQSIVYNRLIQYWWFLRKQNHMSKVALYDCWQLGIVCKDVKHRARLETEQLKFTVNLKCIITTLLKIQTKHRYSPLFNRHSVFSALLVSFFIVFFFISISFISLTLRNTNAYSNDFQICHKIALFTILKSVTIHLNWVTKMKLKSQLSIRPIQFFLHLSNISISNEFWYIKKIVLY